MRKVAIFTEGQGELIFIRYLLPQIVGYEHLSFECLELRSDKLFNVPYKFGSPDNAKIHFMIVNVDNDEKVLSAIAERETRLVQQGYDEIIGLRDMYSHEYRKRANTVDQQIVESFIHAHNATIQRMSNSDRIQIFFAIMELEAWFLSMYNLFQKIHPSLTCLYIEEQVGFDLATVNPEKEFFHPANEFSSILDIVEIKYTKSSDQMESILAKMDTTDINNALENGRCNSFALFLSTLREEKNA